MTDQLQVVDEQPTEERVVKLANQDVEEIENILLTVYERARLYSGAETCHAITRDMDDRGMHPRVVEALVELEEVLIMHGLIDGFLF